RTRDWPSARACPRPGAQGGRDGQAFLGLGAPVPWGSVARVRAGSPGSSPPRSAAVDLSRRSAEPSEYPWSTRAVQDARHAAVRVFPVAFRVGGDGPSGHRDERAAEGSTGLRFRTARGVGRAEAQRAAAPPRGGPGKAVPSPAIGAVERARPWGGG